MKVFLYMQRHRKLTTTCLFPTKLGSELGKNTENSGKQDFKQNPAVFQGNGKADPRIRLVPRA